MAAGDVIGNSDDFSFGYSEGWDNAKLWWEGDAEHQPKSAGWGPDYFLSRPVGARPTAGKPDSDGNKHDRLQYIGRRRGHGDFFDAVLRNDAIAKLP